MYLGARKEYEKRLRNEAVLIDAVVELAQNTEKAAHYGDEELIAKLDKAHSINERLEAQIEKFEDHIKFLEAQSAKA